MPDYGGTFDIDPSCYWGREDLNEFSGELEDYNPCGRENPRF